MVTRFLCLILLCVPSVSWAQTLVGERARLTERIIIGTSTFGTTSPLQVVGLPTRSGETLCLWVDASGNVKSGTCPVGDITGVTVTLGSDADDLLAVTGSPCTSGDCAFTVNFNAQNNGVVLAGPTTGGPLDPTFRQLLLDELGNPSGNKTFTMANKTLVFTFTTPTGGDGAFEIEATGGFTGDLFHLHQLTGNPGAGTDLAHFESSDADVTGLRITANAAATALNVTSGLTQLTGNTTVTGTLTVSSTVAANGGSITSTGALAITPASGNLTLNPSGDVEFNPTGNDLLPTSNYDLNIGALSKKYLTLHAAELWVETLVAQNTIATIGGRILVGPTTALTLDLAPATTFICVKHNEMTTNDRVYLEANGAVEFLAITSTPTTDHASCNATVTDYHYTVTRNLDGPGADQWYAGDAVFNTGTTNDGFIDLYSVRGVKSASEAGPTIVGNVRTNTGYADWAARWAIGNLNGLYGYGATTYGVAFGDPAEANIVIDATNGIRIRDGTTPKLTMDTSGNLSLVGDIVMGTGGVLRSGATAVDTGIGYWLAHNAGTPQFRIGNPAGNRVKWDGTDLTVVSANVVLDSTGLTVAYRSGSAAGTGYGFQFDSPHSATVDGLYAWYTAATAHYMALYSGAGTAANNLRLAAFARDSSEYADYQMAASGSVSSQTWYADTFQFNGWASGSAFNVATTNATFDVTSGSLKVQYGFLEVESTVPYVQFDDTTGSATDYHIVNDGNNLWTYSGTYGSGSAEFGITTSEVIVVDSLRVEVAGGGEGIFAYDATTGGNLIYSITRQSNNTSLTTYDNFGIKVDTTSASSTFDFEFQNSGGSNHELLVRGKASHSCDGCYGVILTLERSTGTNNTPGMILFNTGDNAYHFVWVGDDDKLRIGPAPQGDGSPGNDSGTVVGDQASALAAKNILGERFDPGTSLDLVLNTRVFDFTYKSGAYHGETFTGIVTDYAPWFGMNENQALNPVNSTGHLVQAIKAQQAKINTLEARLRALEAR